MQDKDLKDLKATSQESADCVGEVRDNVNLTKDLKSDILTTREERRTVSGNFIDSLQVINQEANNFDPYAGMSPELRGILQAFENQSGSSVVYERKVDALGRAYATGRRKSSSARVWIRPGDGKFMVGNKNSDQYFGRDMLKMVINQPFDIVKRKFDVFCTISGGGTSSQAQALRLGISRALVNFDPSYRSVLKHAGLLTRDSREVERKKAGLHKARKSTQYSKR